MIKISHIIYYLLSAIVGGVMSTTNYGINSWQFWVILGCYFCGYICGREW